MAFKKCQPKGRVRVSTKIGAAEQVVKFKVF